MTRLQVRVNELNIAKKALQAELKARATDEGADYARGMINAIRVLMNRKKAIRGGPAH